VLMNTNMKNFTFRHWYVLTLLLFLFLMIPLLYYSHCTSNIIYISLYVYGSFLTSQMFIYLYRNDELQTTIYPKLRFIILSELYIIAVTILIFIILLFVQHYYKINYSDTKSYNIIFIIYAAIINYPVYHYKNKILLEKLFDKVKNNKPKKRKSKHRRKKVK